MMTHLQNANDLFSSKHAHLIPHCLQVHHVPLGQRVPLLSLAGLLQGAPLGAAPLRRLDTHGMGQDQGHRRRLHATRE